MKTRILCIGASFALALAVMASLAAAAENDCNADRSAAEVPGSATDVPGTGTSDTLTEKLATCGSVLTPPPLGDTDIIEPAPPVGEDMNINPDSPPQN